MDYRQHAITADICRRSEHNKNEAVSQGLKSYGAIRIIAELLT